MTPHGSCVQIVTGYRYQNYGVKLNELKGERKKVLEEVMENESYKNAKELLQRYRTMMQNMYVFSRTLSHFPAVITSLEQVN